MRLGFLTNAYADALLDVVPKKYRSPIFFPAINPMPVIIPVHSGKKNTVLNSNRPRQICSFTSGEFSDHELPPEADFSPAGVDVAGASGILIAGQHAADVVFAPNIVVCASSWIVSRSLVVAENNIISWNTGGVTVFCS